MFNHRNYVEQLFNVKSIAPGGLTLDQLRPFQLAVFDENTQRTVASPSDCKNKKFRLVYRTPSTGTKNTVWPDQKNLKLPVSSFPIGFVDKIEKFEAATENRPVFEAYLGYNGESACRSLKLDCGKTYELTIHATGKPVTDTFGRSLTEIIPYTAGCCENCTIAENGKTTVVGMVEAIKNFSNHIGNFIDVHPVYDCCPVDTPFSETAMHAFYLTICDAGDANALGDVQVAYQTLDIYRSDRNGGYSTYKVECAASSPASYVQTGTVLSDCATCPSGFTSGPARKKYILEVDNASNGTNASQWLTEVQAVSGWSTAVSAKRLQTINGVAKYEVLVPTSFSAPTITADAKYTFVADVPLTCTLTSPATTAWVQGEAKYKIKRKLQITLKNNDCGDTTDDLAALTTFVAAIPDYVSGSITQEIAGDCISIYTIEQYSNCVEDGCDWKGGFDAKFAKFPNYGQGEWVAVQCDGWTFDQDGCPVAPAPVDAADCRAGLKFVSKNFENDILDCTDDYWQNEQTEGLEIYVSIADTTVNGCDRMDVDYTVVSRPLPQRGSGRALWRREIQIREGDGLDYIGANACDGLLTQDRKGEVYAVDPKKFYHTIDIFHNYTRNRGAVQGGVPIRERITLACEADKTALFADLKTLANTIATIQGNCDLL